MKTDDELATGRFVLLLVIVGSIILCSAVLALGNERPPAFGSSAPDSSRPSAFVATPPPAKPETGRRPQTTTVRRQPTTTTPRTTTATPRRQIIRRAGHWTWPGNSYQSLLRHLRGEIGDPQHRSQVQGIDLRGRSFAELRAIHSNLHEGWTWDGTTRRRNRF